MTPLGLDLGQRGRPRGMHGDASAKCLAADCGAAHEARGLCGLHYQRWRLYGSTDLPPRPTVVERFWSKVNKTPLCWEWTDKLNSHGYGRFSVSGHQVGARQFSWWLAHGLVPKGWDVDHLCRNTACVRPSHLESVTHQENNIRGIAGEVNRRRRLAVTHCPQGHPYDEANTSWRQTKAGMSRQCKTCGRDYARRVAAQQKAAAS